MQQRLTFTGADRGIESWGMIFVFVSNEQRSILLVTVQNNFTNREENRWDVILI